MTQANAPSMQRAEQHRHRRASAPSDSASRSRCPASHWRSRPRARRASVMPIPISACVRPVRIDPRLVQEQQREPAIATADPTSNCRPSRWPRKMRAEQRIGHQQQREHHRDQPRGDVLLGAVDEVEVEAELRPARAPSQTASRARRAAAARAATQRIGRASRCPRSGSDR